MKALYYLLRKEYTFRVSRKREMRALGMAGGAHYMRVGDRQNFIHATSTMSPSRITYAAAKNESDHESRPAFFGRRGQRVRVLIGF